MKKFMLVLGFIILASSVTSCNIKNSKDKLNFNQIKNEIFEGDNESAYDEIVYSELIVPESIGIDLIVGVIIDNYENVEYKYKDNIATIITSRSNLDKIIIDIENTIGTIVESYTNNEMLNSIEFNEAYTSLTIDYKSTNSTNEMKYLFSSLSNLLTYFNAFNGVKADELEINILLLIDGKLEQEFCINKEFLLR